MLPPRALAALRPSAIAELAAQHEHAADAEAARLVKPQLLLRLEAVLQAGQAAAQPLAALATPWGLAQLELAAHRRVLELFTASLTTYKPLLSRVRAAYEAALADAAAAAADAVHLQTLAADSAQRQAEAVAAARDRAEQIAAGMCEELASKLSDLQSRAEQTEQECTQLDEALSHMQAHMLQARRECEQLESSNKRALKELVEASSWGNSLTARG